MAEEEDQQHLQKYLDNLNKEMEDNQEEDEDGNLVLTITTEIDGEDNNDEEDCNNGTIIMDADGNYYFQTSDKIVEVKPLKKESPVKKVPATILTPSNKRKKSENQLNSTKASSSSSLLKQTILEDSCKKVKKELTEIETNETEVTETQVTGIYATESVVNETETTEAETIIPNSEEPLTSQMDENDEHVYEYDETEQDPDDCLYEKDEEYESKALLKPIKNESKKDFAAIFNCMLCPYETTKRYLLSRHLRIHSDERPYKCSVCERGFKTNASLLNHVNTHLGNKPHACKDCGKTFTTSGELVRHVRYRHTHIKPHKCTECDYSSVEMSKLRRHMRCHTGERPYQCPHCTYASPDTFKLKRHMRTHTGEKPYECDICHARFTQSNSLKYHRLIHSVNDKPVFQCHLCPTTCGRKTDLRLHIKKLHNSDQPIPCKRCGKELPDRYSYKMHVKTHEGEKCYRCTLCAYASITQRHLESHMLIHSDTKPFACELCDMTFRQKQLLTRHTKIYHTDNYQPPQPRKKDHKCPHCDRTFAFNGNLIRHMETHDPSSQMSIEKQKLRMGRMKRLQPDGSIVTVPILKRTIFPENDGYMYEDNEEQGDGEEGETYEGEYEQEEQEGYEEEYEEYNDGQVQYVYEDFEEEFEGEKQEELSETKPNVDIEMEKLAMGSSLEQKAQRKTIAVKQENDDSHLMELQADDDNGFMVIEVMQDDEEEGIVDNEHEPKASTHQVRHNVINNNDTNETVTKTSSEKSTFINTSDCFGFEVDDEDEEEEDEETKGAIKLLNLIEQE